MTAPPVLATPIAPEERARALLAAHLPALHILALDHAQRLADAARRLSASQVRGLGNAVAPGPQQRLGSLRLDTLARYLAWRKQRSDEGGSWDSLAPKIKQAIVDLEQACRFEAKELQSHQPFIWQQNAKAWQSALDWLEIEVLESFLQALERLATSSPQDAKPASGGSSS